MSGFDRVCVVGAGYLGTQIGLTCALHGYDVFMYDISKESLNSSKIEIEKYLEEWIQSGDFSKYDSNLIKEKIQFSENLLDSIKDADIVIEAVVEKLDVKRSVFKELDKICSQETLIATNSSSIRVSLLDDGLEHPERVLNMHFYSYPWRRRIVEIMKGTSTSSQVIEKASNFSNKSLL
jgi:3-hydroxybutyryl-CoA dehydrogenase